MPPDSLVEAAASIMTYYKSLRAPELIGVIGPLMDVVLDSSNISAGNSMIAEFIASAEESEDPDITFQVRCMARLWHCVTQGFHKPLTPSESDLAYGGSNSWMAGFGHFARGTIAMVAGNLRAAEQELNEALNIYQQQKDDVRVSAAYANLGVVLTELAEFDAAQRCLEANLASPCFTHRLRTYSNLATLSLERGHFGHAIATAESLLRANESYDAKKYTNTAHAIIGLAKLDSGDVSGAAPHLAILWSNERSQLEDQGDTAYIVSFVTRCLAAAGQHEQAVKLATAYALRLEGKDALGQLRVRSALAEALAVAAHQSAYPTAKAVYRDCLAIDATTIGRRVQKTMFQTRV
jgi:tetratricopeptide (TPR) repeat protein